MATNKTMEMLRNEKNWKLPELGNPAVRHLWRLQELAQQHKVPDIVQEEIDTILQLIQAREQYGENMSSGVSTELSYISKETYAHPWKKLFDEGKMSYPAIPIMISGVFEAQFLQTLIGMSNAKRVLELGLFTGFSALAVAEALPEDGEVYSCEIEPYLKELARSFLDRSPHGKKVTIKGPAMETLQEMADNGTQFDLIFIDCDKPGYIPCYKIIMDRNILAPGGTIVVDNVFALGYPYSGEGMSAGEAIKEFNEMVKNDDRVKQVLVPIRDGITLIRRK